MILETIMIIIIIIVIILFYVYIIRYIWAIILFRLMFVRICTMIIDNFLNKIIKSYNFNTSI